MKLLLRFLVPIVSLAIGVGVVALSGGCGSSSPPPGPATVRGKVTFNGQPVAGGLVVFAPDPRRGGSGKPARSQTAIDGTFQLQFENSPHIPAGWYRVSLAPAPVIPDPLFASPMFPTKLARPDMSGIEREVLAGNNHNFEFTIEAPTN